MTKLRLLAVMLISVGGLLAAGGAMWALHEYGKLYASGFAAALLGYVLLLLGIFAVDRIEE